MMTIGPMMVATMPIDIARRGSSRANTNPTTADVAGATAPVRPMIRPLSTWKTLWTMPGASPPDRPASIQTAASTGAVVANSRRATVGMATRWDQ